MMLIAEQSEPRGIIDGKINMEASDKESAFVRNVRLSSLHVKPSVTESEMSDTGPSNVATSD